MSAAQTSAIMRAYAIMRAALLEIGTGTYSAEEAEKVAQRAIDEAESQE